MSYIRNKWNGGLVDTIVLIVVALIILGYFNIDLKDIFSNSLVTDNIKYAFQLVIDAFYYIWTTVSSIVEKFLHA